MSATASTLAIIRGILEEDPMKRWQDPAIEIRSEVPRPYYFIRPYVPKAGSAGLKRVRKRIPLGFCDEMTMRKAHARKQEIMAPINQGKFILQAQIRFQDLIEKYREARVSKLGAATQKKYEGHLVNHIIPVFGNAELADIDQQSIEAWLATEAKSHTHGEKQFRGLGWWALSDLRNILSAVFTAAIDWGLWHGTNPCARIDIGRKIEKREKRIPKAVDLIRFIELLSDVPCADARMSRLIVLTAVVSGLRVSEVLGLQVGDIDPIGRTLQVRRRWHRGDVSVPKSDSSKRIREIGPLADELLSFAEGREFEDWIFQTEGQPPDDRDLQQYVFRPAAELAGIYFEGFGMHSLRRLNLSWRQEVGATPLEAMKAAGHAQLSTTWLYTITDPERERAHVEAILERLTPKGKSTVN